MGETNDQGSSESATMNSQDDQTGLIDPETVRTIFEAVFTTEGVLSQLQILHVRLSALLGDEEDRAAQFIDNCSLDPAGRSADGGKVDFSPELGPAASTLFRSLRAMFGPQLESALAAYQEIPANWKIIDLSPKVHLQEEVWEAEFAIERFDGEQFSLVGPPIAYLRIVSFLMERLAVVPANLANYDDDSLHRYAEARSAFEEALEEVRQAAVDAANVIIIEERE